MLWLILIKTSQVHNSLRQAHHEASLDSFKFNLNSSTFKDQNRLIEWHLVDLYIRKCLFLVCESVGKFRCLCLGKNSLTVGKMIQRNDLTTQSPEANSGDMFEKRKQINLVWSFLFVVV